jgi:hypothetical protein
MRFLKTSAQKGSPGNLPLQRSKAGNLPTGLLLHSALKVLLTILFGADPARIGLLEKPPAAEHSFPSKSQ